MRFARSKRPEGRSRGRGGRKEKERGKEGERKEKGRAEERLPDTGEAALEETAEVILPVGPSMAASGFVIEVLNMIQFEPFAVVLELLIEEIIRSDSNPIHGRHLA